MEINKKIRALTRGITNKGFRGLRRLSLASNSVYLDRLSLRYPLLAIPSTVGGNCKDLYFQCQVKMLEDFFTIDI